MSLYHNTLSRHERAHWAYRNACFSRLTALPSTGFTAESSSHFLRYSTSTSYRGLNWRIIYSLGDTAAVVIVYAPAKLSSSAIRISGTNGLTLLPGIDLRLSAPRRVVEYKIPTGRCCGRCGGCRRSSRGCRSRKKILIRRSLCRHCCGCRGWQGCWLGCR